ncbi:hypothetical protein [Ekhidna sp. To15]|uniref:hypothetical protein n=1 Tax=Ekhidna sp. To15 TaxID=3395267 RepID=UPI003F527451
MIDMNQEDDLLKRLFEESEVQSSSSITEKVMHRIDVNPKAFEYEPVISKKVWVVLGSMFALVMAYLLFDTSANTFEVPKLFVFLQDSFSGLSDSFTFEVTKPSLPKIPSTILIAIAAINVIGIYLMISYRWVKGLFR